MMIPVPRRLLSPVKYYDYNIKNPRPSEGHPSKPEREVWVREEDAREWLHKTHDESELSCYLKAQILRLMQDRADDEQAELQDPFETLPQKDGSHG